MPTPVERYGLIGTGSRAELYIWALTRRFPERGDLVAWSDLNEGRLDLYESELPSGTATPARYAPADLEQMIAEQRIGRMIITTPDYTHAEYIVRTLEAGADVVVEKPLTIDAESVRRIRSAIETTGREVITTFNYRYSPRNSALKRLIVDGSIGDVTSVHFEWVLDTAHGADYFRRWHRDKANSGGLLIHKASHHFDLVNWWIDSSPARVFASGGLKFYGADAARARGLEPTGVRGTESVGDPFALDLTADERTKKLYFDVEHLDGYRRDRNVFDEGITIEDNLSVLVDYVSGATMSYSLNAHSPWEGYRVAINGTLGRAELDVVERGAVLVADDGAVTVDPSANPALFAANSLRPESERLLVQRHWGVAEEVEIPSGVGGHGGGDELLLEHLLGRVTVDEPLHRVAGFRDGVRAVSVGIAANRSLETGLPVSYEELAPGV